MKDFPILQHNAVFALEIQKGHLYPIREWFLCVAPSGIS